MSQLHALLKTFEKSSPPAQVSRRQSRHNTLRTCSIPRNLVLSCSVTVLSRCWPSPPQHALQCSTLKAVAQVIDVLDEFTLRKVILPKLRFVLENDYDIEVCTNAYHITYSLL